MAEHNETGKQGEEIAAEYLMKQGYTILERNWHNRHQEIDIIASIKHELVIVEVKCRSGNPLAEPYTAVNKNKQNLLIKAANAYIQVNDLDMETRFDIITVIIGKHVSIKHIAAAFYPCIQKV